MGGAMPGEGKTSGEGAPRSWHEGRERDEEEKWRSPRGTHDWLSKDYNETQERQEQNSGMVV